MSVLISCNISIFSEKSLHARRIKALGHVKWLLALKLPQKQDDAPFAPGGMRAEVVLPSTWAATHMTDQHTKMGGANILIVDDLTAMRKVLRKLLQSIGYSQITEARDASEAVVKLQSESFDLIISDWNMPTMTGQDLLEYVRSDPRFKDLPFVMLTSLADRDSVVAALRSGVSDYLAKPFTVQELEQKMTAVWSRESVVCK